MTIGPQRHRCRAQAVQLCQDHEVQNLTMKKVVAPVRVTAGLGVLGMFVAEDPEPENTLVQKGGLARLLRE